MNPLGAELRRPQGHAASGRCTAGGQAAARTPTPQTLHTPQEAKLLRAGEPDRVRALFERVTSLALPPKKMKTMFRRWLEHERAHGTAARAEEVKRRALAYVQAAVGQQGGA
jgi:hypothetical protein